MDKKQNKFMNIWFISILTMSLMFGMVRNVFAEGINDDTIPSGEVLEEDVLLTGTDIIIDGGVAGDVIAIGTNIQVNGPIEGSAILLGRDVTIDETVDGSVYTLAVNLNLGSSTELNRSLYFVGLRLQTDPESSIERDLTVLSLSAKLAGRVGRHLNTIIGLLDVISSFGRDRGIEKSEPESGIVPAQPVFVEYNLAKGTDYLIEPVPDFKDWNQLDLIPRALQLEEEELGLQPWLVDSIQTFISLLIFGLIALWLFPGFMKNSISQIKDKPLAATGYGLLGLVISFNLVGVAFILAAIIGVVGFFLGTALLWELAWSFWALGFTSLGFLITVFVLFVIYISKALVAYFAGDFLLQRIAPGAAKYRVLSLLLGVLAYSFIIAIPYLGWVVGILVTAWGLGASWLALNEIRRTRKTEKELQQGEESATLEAENEQGEDTPETPEEDADVGTGESSEAE